MFTFNKLTCLELESFTSTIFSYVNNLPSALNTWRVLTRCNGEPCISNPEVCFPFPKNTLVEGNGDVEDHF